MLARNILLLEPSGMRTTRQSPLTTSTTYVYTLHTHYTLDYVDIELSSSFICLG